MKSYMAPGHFRLTGKAWQIRHLLKQWRDKAEPGILLQEWISRNITAGASSS
ncbi:Z-ring formation inhibitor MciZ [Paenibacillus caui]|uniref:Z-ring formation inhibitor MciZ n=1 Tax=Paenibacillus caui TaxID=2873927 RepID=UPI001CA7D964|nr:Z-ring formation inhibitor MciZ [Paenibacillus caui]